MPGTRDRQTRRGGAPADISPSLAGRPPPLMLSRIQPPRMPTPLAAGQRYAGWLEDVLEHSLTLVRAPSGYGKTTVCTNLFNAAGERGCHTAWVSFDVGDDGSATALTYIVEALGRSLGSRIEEAHALLRDDLPIAGQAIAALLVNAVVECAEPVVLFLDDFDRVRDTRLARFLSYVLLHSPRNLHTVISCQAKPGLPLSVLQAHGGVFTLDADMLRLRREETRELLSHGRDRLPPDQVDSLHDAMAGWVTGLKIGALALRNNRDAVSDIGLVKQGARWLSEYLDDNIFHHLPEHVRTFLTRCSIVNLMTPELCARLCGTDSDTASGVLEWLADENLFVQPLDDEGGWYRLHPVFREYLSERADSDLAEDLQSLHAIASHWYARNGRMQEAVRHALASGDLPQAVEWAEQTAMKMVERSELSTLLSWIGQLPEDAVRHRVPLRLAEAWALALSLRPRAETVLNELTDVLDASADSAFSESLRHEILGVRAIFAGVYRDRADETLKLCTEYLSHALNEDTFTTRAVRNAAAFGIMQSGDFDRARALMRPSQLIEAKREQLFTMAYRQSLIGQICKAQGYLEEAERTFDASMRHCEARLGRRSASASLLAAFLAENLYERDMRGEADNVLANRLPVIEDSCYHDAVSAAYETATRLRLAEGNRSEAAELIERAELLAHERDWQRLLAKCTVLRLHAGLPLTTDPIATTDLIDEGIDACDPLSDRARIFLIQAEACALQLMDAGDMDRCRLVLDRAHRLSSRVHNVGPGLIYGLLRAQLLDRNGRANEANRVFAEVLTQAAALGYKRTLADRAPRGLIENFSASDEAARQSPAERMLLTFLRAQAGNQTAPLVRPAAGNPAEQPSVFSILTAREIDILAEVAGGHSNKEIARRLHLTPETVKWHMKNIMRKLSAENRTQAVERALALGLTTA